MNAYTCHTTDTHKCLVEISTDVHTHMNVCMCMHVQSHLKMTRPSYIHTHVYMHVCMCMYVCKNTYKNDQAALHKYIHTFVYVCTYIHIFVCVCMYAKNTHENDQAVIHAYIHMYVNEYACMQKIHIKKTRLSYIHAYICM